MFRIGHIRDMENTNKSVFNKITVLVFLIGIVVGFGSASLWLRRNKNISAAPESASTVSGESPAGTSTDKTANAVSDSSLAEASKALSGAKESIAVHNQPSGDMVSIDSISSEQGVWVAVHEDEAGKPGRILGAQLFLAGNHSGVVELLRATAENKIYYAMLHRDDGDHVFDAAKDLPIKNADGNPAMARFTATSVPGTQ